MVLLGNYLDTADKFGTRLEAELWLVWHCRFTSSHKRNWGFDLLYTQTRMKGRSEFLPSEVESEKGNLNWNHCSGTEFYFHFPFSWSYSC